MGARMKEAYIEKIYAGWLAKMIGIRHGAPIEGWTYEKIGQTYGEIGGYLVDYKDKLFAADDDSNGPCFFVRAIQDAGGEPQASDVAEALLNYAPFEHGFFWWGGYGVSTEHTAYLNLQNGIEAPGSGSIEQNGAVVAEQIGGQIFIDVWGLVSPGNPAQAARLAQRAASVTHGGNGIYGGVFIACCISAAFEEEDIRSIIRTGLSFIPKDCTYARVVREVEAFYDAHPGDWRACYRWIRENHGYSRYGGVCHIIPNAAVMILSLLYGEGDFSRTINICNMCGWDTDCNVGNIATIMGVRKGTAGIDFEKWGRELQDLLVCSSVIGSLNLRTISEFAGELAVQAYRLAGEELPGKWRELLRDGAKLCHFEFPQAIHGFCAEVRNGRTVSGGESASGTGAAKRQDPAAKEQENGSGGKQEGGSGREQEGGSGREQEGAGVFAKTGKVRLENTDEEAFSGERSLKCSAYLEPGEALCVYRRSYLFPDEFYDSRYDPAFSPRMYPGQTVRAQVMAKTENSFVCLYARDARSGKIEKTETVPLKKGVWRELTFRIPGGTDSLITEYGMAFEACGESVFYIDDVLEDARADYAVDFRKEREEKWTDVHREISQFTRMKGMLFLEDGRLNLSCADSGEAYTGLYGMGDCRVRAALTPLMGERHMVLLRVQGARRCYAAGFTADGEAAVLKKCRGSYQVLARADFRWERKREYTLEFAARGDRLSLSVDGELLIETRDAEAPYRYGCVGVAVQENSRSAYSRLEIRGE